MKAKNIFLGIAVAALALSGCDEIANPLKSTQVTGSLPSGKPTFVDSSATSGANSYSTYKVLVEDNMGHECTNCPPAVYAGDALIGSSSPFPGQVVLMEVNNGIFALTTIVQGTPDTAFDKDYTSVAGNNWETEFGVAAVGWPFGMVNRMGFPSSCYVNFNNWQTTVQGLITANPTPLVTIQIHDSCWVPQRIIGVEFQVTFKKVQDTACVLEAVIIQDSIIDWQKDGNSPSGLDTNFVHRNVLRGSFDLTGTGVAIPTTASMTIGGTFTSYQIYNFTTGENGRAAGNPSTDQPPWNMARCRIVAFVYNTTSKMVLQAEEINVE